MYKNVVIPERCAPPAPGSRSFNKGCKPHDMLDSRFTLRGPGMTKHGFTLIELLVVVLIIGILSAVALPQYTKAVEKSRAAQALAVLKSFGQAMENYYLANGTYVTRFDELDMDFPWSGTEKWYSLATDTRSNGEWSLQIINDGGYPGIYIGRLTGRYKGGGFGFFLNDKAKYGDYRVICLERHRDGVTLAGKAGDYCERVMGGKPQGSAGGTRGYSLP